MERPKSADDAGARRGAGSGAADALATVLVLPARQPPRLSMPRGDGMHAAPRRPLARIVQAPMLVVGLPLTFMVLTVYFVGWLILLSLLMGATMLSDVARRLFRRPRLPLGTSDRGAIA